MGSDPRDDDERLREILEIVFLAEERGEAVDLSAACGGDPTLEAVVRELLASESTLVRRVTISASTPASDAREPDEFPSDRLGEYKLLRRIGRGGMGSVWLAEQEPYGRRVALKILHARMLGNDRARLRFQREAQVAAVLQRPNIVPVFAVGEHDGWAFIAMRFLSGPALDEVALPLAPREVARIGVAVARALDEAHVSGIIHRDVKPANILLDGEVPFVVDFGLARAQGDATLTRPHAVPGTLPYLSPEQLQANSPVLDPRVDVYALGATLYQLASGAPPFHAEDPEQIVGQILLQDPAPLRLPRQARDLETILRKALEKDAGRRFASAAEFADELERFLEGRPIHSRPTGLVGRTYRLALRHKRSSALLLSAGALVIALTIVLLLAWSRERRNVQRGIDHAQALLRADEIDGALDVLRPLQAAGRDARIDDLVDVAERRAAVAKLLRIVLARREAIDLRELDRAVQLVRDRRPVAEDARTAGLASILAAWHLDRVDAARAEIERWRNEHGDGRALRALQHLVAGDGGWDLGTQRSTATEHVIAAAAAMLAFRPLAEQELEIERALAQEPGNANALYALAVALAVAGEPREGARVLEALARASGTRREVWRDLARIRITMGDLEAGRAALERIPWEEWTAVEAYVALDHRWRAGDVLLLRAELARAIERWPEAPEIRRVSAEIAGMLDGRVEEAYAELERLRTDAGVDFLNRDQAAYSQVRLRLSALETEGERAERRLERLEELIALADQHLVHVRWRPTRGLLSWLKGRALKHAGQRERALASYHAAIEFIPTHPGARLDFALLVWELLAGGTLEAEKKRALTAEALAHVRELLERAEAREVSLASTERMQALQALAIMAKEQGDALAIERFGPELVPLMASDTSLPYFEELLRWARELSARMYE